MYFRILTIIKGAMILRRLMCTCGSYFEKLQLEDALTGKISIIYGTHTHVQTADECILPNGTGYITDLECAVLTILCSESAQRK